MQSEAIFFDKKESIIPVRVASQSIETGFNRDESKFRLASANYESDDYENELRRHNN
jgi:hypothetical protein